MSQATATSSFRAARSPFVVHDPRFAAVLGPAPRLTRAAAVDAHEGPVYVPDEDALYFTTVPRPVAGRPSVAIERLGLDDGRVSVVRTDANMANGMALDHDGRLVVCEQGTQSRPAALTRVDRATGRSTTLVDSWRGMRLNSPNDVVVQGDGTLWFTDPSYGFLQGFRPEPQAGDYVYRYEPDTGDLRVAAASFVKPNGLALSPDERVLYVGDNGSPQHIKAFDVGDDGWLRNERVFAVLGPGHPDGLAVDSEGRVYASAPSGIHVFDHRGRLLGEISLPGAVNFTFGGQDRNVLYVTADDAIWAAHLAATGPPQPKGA